MKTTQQSAATLRAIIRWTTGSMAAISITTVACLMFPVLSCLPAFALVACLAGFIGLQIALPPVDEEDDWVPVRANREKEEIREGATVVPFPSQVRKAV